VIKKETGPNNFKGMSWNMSGDKLAVTNKAPEVILI
jgi:hypothetical protein